ncbi:tyrosine-type recombinase/integrase [Parabacteroides pacaensis]|uniref:tyrosine-type recombinase/integrase n=1 Tax=Parabacteroides pacaensis TaxID=2086575 RepID=UPI000D0EE0AC|nr:site-specific integrase [Parabacteroides pacaensis]
MKRRTKNESECGRLVEAFNILIAQKRKEGYLRTADNYQSTVNKLQTYLSGRAVKLMLHDITEEWVTDFGRWLKEKHSGKPQTADFYFRNLRALYNGVCMQYKCRFPGKLNPFQKISFIKKPSPKRALPKEKLEKLLVPTFRKEVPEYLHPSLDILLFILFMRGMVFQDVYNLTWDMVQGDTYLYYLRSKTQVAIDMEISSEARTIMERYRKEGCNYVFPFLHCSKNKKELSEQSALRRVNRHACLIGKLADLPIPLSTYVMRHTFATLMLETAKPVELISQCLGHTSIRTTQIYLSRISNKRVDREVNDMLNQMLRPTSEIEKKNKERQRQKISSIPPLQKNITTENIFLTDKKLKAEVPTKNYLFLHKKEIPFSRVLCLRNFFLAKILGLYNIAKFLPYFSFL